MHSIYWININPLKNLGVIGKIIIRLIIFIKIQYKIDKLMEIFSVICFQSIIPLLLNNKTCRGLLLKFISYAMSSAVNSKI